MAMLITWHTLNKLAAPQDRRFSDAFLIVTPGITIRDRLRVLLPNDPQNYYRQLDLVPLDMMPDLGKVAIVITNRHAFKLREFIVAAKLTKQILRCGGTPAFTESPAQMVNRVCRPLGNKRNIVVINDEAHHCYRRKPDADAEKLTGDDRKEAEQREEAARMWISGLEAVKQKLGVKVVYDLSATPFFLRGSGYREGLLFPWVVTDFSLMDAIESGIVKVPRVPVDDNAMQGGLPTYRYLWPRIREALPRKGRGIEALGGDPQLPRELEGALQSLYSNYEKYYRQWEQNTEAQKRGLTPPVFIVVCNNTNVSKLVFDYISGYERTLPNGNTVRVPGRLPLFSNVREGRWIARPNTILVDSEQLESGEAMSPEFKKIAAHEIEDFKAEYRRRFPGRDIENVTDEDLLREVLNTVSKPGKLGEQIKCVVSVSMLTEGWDANTVTHILGVRAFGTQLLCEQVVGRALRRISYVADEHDMFAPEYAEVYGIPFSFINSIAPQSNPRLPIPTTRVRALPELSQCAIQFPRLLGYRYDLPPTILATRFTDDSRMELSTADVPTTTENAPIVGESSIHSLDDLKRRRPQEVAFLLAKLVLEKYFRHDGTQRDGSTSEHRFEADVQAWLFPQVLQISRQWLHECVVCKDDTFPQLLLLIEYAHGAADRIYRSIVAAAGGDKMLMPILHPYDTTGSTHYVDFNTSRATYITQPDKCHVSHVVLDSQWEGKIAHVLEHMDEVISYVKNDHLGFTIPYTHDGEERSYVPDYIALLNNGSEDSLLHVIIEVTGERKRDKEAKVATARNLWVPAVNNHAGWGRWAFVEVTDPWDAQHKLRELL
jgi:type III restriction enzyme